MSPSGEEHLQKAVSCHQASDFKKGIKEAEKARKKFQKEGRTDRAVEALRVMGDCTLNARDLKKAQKIYESLLQDATHIRPALSVNGLPVVFQSTKEKTIRHK